MKKKASQTAYYYNKMFHGERWAYLQFKCKGRRKLTHPSVIRQIINGDIIILPF